MSVAEFCKQSQEMLLEQMELLSKCDPADEEKTLTRVNIARQMCECAAVGNASCSTTIKLVELQSKISNKKPAAALLDGKN